MASQPTFDLQVEGRPFSSAMNYFAARGYDTWCVDMEGYGRSTKDRDIFCDIANGAECHAFAFTIDAGRCRRESTSFDAARDGRSYPLPFSFRNPSFQAFRRPWDLNDEPNQLVCP
jgi:hypothetical protein